MTSAAVVIASAGRPAVLADGLRSCAGLAGVDFTGVVSVPDEHSLPDDPAVLDGWQVVSGVRGASAQRNNALRALDGVDVVAFFDDDSVVRPDYLRNAVAFLDAHPEVLGLTGRVLLDGATGPEIPLTTATAALDRSSAEVPSGRWRPSRTLYGCNFVVRIGRVPHVRFDERLPLYSWLEDHDLARRLLKLGPLAKVDDCVIVHRGAASGGRKAHVRLGYSQVMNPVHLVGTGSFPVGLAAREIGRPVAKNVLYSLIGRSSGPWRRERLRGNAMAAADALRGRITPERILDL